MAARSDKTEHDGVGRQKPGGRIRSGLQETDQLQPANLVAALDRIYDLRRNCLLNELYYGYRLTQFKRLGLAFEIAIITGTGASGVSGWMIWTVAPQLKAVWAVIAALATLLAAIKPVVKIDGIVRRYSTLFSGYRELSVAMGYVADDVAQYRCITPEIEREVSRLRSRYKKLAEDDDPPPRARLVDELQRQVNARVAPESLWYPPPAGAVPVRQV